MYRLGGGYPWDTTGISLQPGTILIYIFLIGTEKTAIKLSSDHFRIKGIAKRNKNNRPEEVCKIWPQSSKIIFQPNAELMHAAEAGEINPTCNGVRRRGMLVRHSKGCAAHCW